MSCYFSIWAIAAGLRVRMVLCEYCGCLASQSRRCFWTVIGRCSPIGTRRGISSRNWHRLFLALVYSWHAASGKPGKS
jgi:hypothetical protein